MTSVRLLDFRVFQEDGFKIQMFGNDELGKKYSIIIDDFKPVFYCKVSDSFDQVNALEQHVRFKCNIPMTDNDTKGLVDVGTVRRKKLVGFDGQKKHKFVFFKFDNMMAFHKVKNLWYYEVPTSTPQRFARTPGMKWTIKPNGYKFGDEYLQLYESNIPPLLRFLHIREISPSGWIEVTGATESGFTTCDFEFRVAAKDVKPIARETPVPYKICSFDIEANSSHGDFPVPVKNYRRLALNIIETQSDDLASCVRAAFGQCEIQGIDLVYPKEMPVDLDKRIAKWLSSPVSNDASQTQMEDSDDEETNAKAVAYRTVIDLMSDAELDRESKTHALTLSLDRVFPLLQGDMVTFIGSTFVKYGTAKPYLNHCIVLGGCAPVPGVVIESYDTEREVLLAWKELMHRENPDILTGYNIFGFDESFMFHRAVETECIEEFLDLTRNTASLAGKCVDGEWEIEEKAVFLASGEYNLRYFNMEGRLQIDMYTLFRRDYTLDSYKLDSVSAYFIGDKVTQIDYVDGMDAKMTRIFSKNLRGLEENNYVVFEEISHSSDLYKNGQKFKVMEVHKDHFLLRGSVSPNIKTKTVKWCLAKDDVDHHAIFKLAKGSNEDRAIIAAYCVQDCNLVHHLMQKVDVLTGFIEMASICSVPIDFLIFRGQGIKLTSYMAKMCRERGTLMPVLESKEYDDGYEGAIVLDPKCDIYSETPIPVGDFSSLYPSCMISETTSHDTKVWTEEYDLDGKLRKPREKTQERYDNLQGVAYVDVEYDTYKYVRKTPKGKAEKVKTGIRRCRWAQIEGAILTSILKELLKARKATKKRMETEPDEFMRNVFDKRQLAYKVTANSLYGQCGARTSTFYEKDVAACCTAVGRKLLIYAKTMIEEVYHERVCATANGDLLVTAEYIYGDTDSVFFKFDLRKDGKQLIGRDALAPSIELAKEACKLVSQFLKGPHDLVYEKTMWPLVLLSKKRYVGMLYEEATDVPKRKSMGIVLKRRDNAPIVKDVYGGLIDILMRERDLSKALRFVQDSLAELSRGEVPLEKLIITKALRSGYKNPGQIAHCVLANRIGRRDYGKKPRPGDRVQYVFVQMPNSKKLLQGEKIETPEYIREQKLKPDYAHYVSNQIMTPVQQVFALVLEELPGFDAVKFAADLAMWAAKLTPEKYEAKVEVLRNKAVEKLVFSAFL